MNDSKYVEIKDEGFGPKDAQFNKSMIELQAGWPGMAEAYEKKFNRPWTNWEFREHARTWAEAWKEAYIALEPVFRKVTTPLYSTLSSEGHLVRVYATEEEAIRASKELEPVVPRPAPSK